MLKCGLIDMSFPAFKRLCESGAEESAVHLDKHSVFSCYILFLQSNLLCSKKIGRKVLFIGNFYFLVKKKALEIQIM